MCYGLVLLLRVLHYLSFHRRNPHWSDTFLWILRSRSHNFILFVLQLRGRFIIYCVILLSNVSIAHGVFWMLYMEGVMWGCDNFLCFSPVVLFITYFQQGRQGIMFAVFIIDILTVCEIFIIHLDGLVCNSPSRECTYCDAYVIITGQQVTSWYSDVTI